MVWGRGVGDVPRISSHMSRWDCMYSVGWVLLRELAESVELSLEPAPMLALVLALVLALALAPVMGFLPALLLPSPRRVMLILDPSALKRLAW